MDNASMIHDDTHTTQLRGIQITETKLKKNFSINCESLNGILSRAVNNAIRARGQEFCPTIRNLHVPDVTK